MDFNNFVRECYLRSNPSVDLNDVTSENPVKCGEHKLLVSEYEKILAEFNKDNDHNVTVACNMWMLQSGPQLVRDSTN